MTDKWKKALAVLFGALMLAGCGVETALVVGGLAAVGAGGGTYAYVNGELKTDYYYTMDKTWLACEKTVADMKGREVVPERKIGEGTIKAVIDGEDVVIGLRYKDKAVTTVSVRVGLFGNKLSSQLIQDRIRDNITKSEHEGLGNGPAPIGNPSPAGSSPAPANR
ncbi:MAG: DUF3568 family protein [Syntrophaceae bacterium]|nr:DUF3568 family protein [Syntrophaceae bacterium]